jgi:hypothetical protein
MQEPSPTISAACPHRSETAALFVLGFGFDWRVVAENAPLMHPLYNLGAHLLELSAGISSPSLVRSLSRTSGSVSPCHSAFTGRDEFRDPGNDCCEEPELEESRL